jgi:hypothetical protein
MVQFRFLNIHISHKTQLAMINMLLNFKVTPHKHIFLKYNFKHDLTWFLVCCIAILIFWDYKENHKIEQ